MAIATRLSIISRFKGSPFKRENKMGFAQEPGLPLDLHRDAVDADLDFDDGLLRNNDLDL